jgi:hypothetical protein
MSAMPNEIASRGLATSLPGPGPRRRSARERRRTARGIPAEPRQHHAGQERRAQEQEHRLDDLHPGGRDHPAEQHVEQHDAADDQDRRAIRQTEQEVDEPAGADHLRDQVEADHGQGAAGGGDAHRPLAQAIGQDVGEGEAAEVAQRLGDEERDDRPADQPADRVDQAVEARHRHQPGDAEEAGRAHVVAGQGEAVLGRAEIAAGREVLAGRAGPARRPVGDAEGDRDEQEEEADRAGARAAERRRASGRRGRGAAAGHDRPPRRRRTAPS